MPMVQPFLQDSSPLRTHRQTHTHRDHATSSVAIGHTYAMKTMRPKNAKEKGQARISADIKDLIVKDKAKDLTAEAKAKDLIAKLRPRWNSSRPRPQRLSLRILEAKDLSSRTHLCIFQDMHF